MKNNKENIKAAALGIGVLGILSYVGYKALKKPQGIEEPDNSTDDGYNFGTGTLVPEDFGYVVGDDVYAERFLQLKKVKKIDGVWSNVDGDVVFNPGDLIGEIYAYQRDYYEPNKLYLIMEEAWTIFSPEYYRLEASQIKI